MMNLREREREKRQKITIINYRIIRYDGDTTNKTTKIPTKPRVSKSISMEIDLMNRIFDEAEYCHRDFSGTISMLIRIGLSVRETQRLREQEEIKIASAAEDQRARDEAAAILSRKVI